MDGILNHGLYGKHGKLVLQKFLILYSLLILEFPRKAVSLDHQIILHIIQFISPGLLMLYRNSMDSDSAIWAMSSESRMMAMLRMVSRVL